MDRRRALALCAAVLLLAAGMGIGRYATLRRGAVLRAGAGAPAMAALATAPAPAAAQPAAQWRVNLNTAAAAELEELPGIGPAIAGRIVAYRQENGDFQAIEEVMAVRGIGEAVFSKIKDYICTE